jgi:hypothetical protein
MITRPLLSCLGAVMLSSFGLWSGGIVTGAEEARRLAPASPSNQPATKDLGPEKTKSPPKRILFIGNSMVTWSGGCARILEELGREDGMPFITSTEACYPAGNLADSADGKNPTLKIVREGKWDLVIMVQGTLFWYKAGLGSDKSVTPERTLLAAETIHKEILGTGARSVIYMSYPHKQSFPNAAKMEEVAEFHRRMKTRMEAVNAKSPVVLVPNGLLWVEGAKHFGEERWYADDHHGSRLAQFANGCLFYAYLTTRDPRRLAYRGTLTQEEADWVKAKAWADYQNDHTPISNADGSSPPR